MTLIRRYASVPAPPPLLHTSLSTRHGLPMSTGKSLRWPRRRSPPFPPLILESIVKPHPIGPPPTFVRRPQPPGESAALPAKTLYPYDEPGPPAWALAMETAGIPMTMKGTRFEHPYCPLHPFAEHKAGRTRWFCQTWEGTRPTTWSTAHWRIDARDFMEPESKSIDGCESGEGLREAEMPPNSQGETPAEPMARNSSGDQTPSHQTDPSAVANLIEDPGGPRSAVAVVDHPAFGGESAGPFHHHRFYTLLLNGRLVSMPCDVPVDDGRGNAVPCGITWEDVLNEAGDYYRAGGVRA